MKKNCVNLRNVKEKDWEFILKIRNQKDVRNACHDTSIIDLDEHFKYMKKLQTKSNVFQWIVILNDLDVGYIKVIDNELGSSLLDEYRGIGIGKLAYDLVFKKLKKNGVKKITAQVKLNRSTPIKFEEETGWVNMGIIYKNGKAYAYKLERIIV
ncbi:hypothetical protein HX850_01865 [Marine Group I thaumarchaeote]|uniref:N-acetyltransferase domain-containing protein n=1 Tax=Marine Group I thaumarchaeote TaxID=2511932 RepID=A0A7K4ML12_9ARCH|nr:hypothetical protein [Marine Group I thaumarchaeote]